MTNEQALELANLNLEKFKKRMKILERRKMNR